jgi:hypothetical protein
MIHNHDGLHGVQCLRGRPYVNESSVLKRIDAAKGTAT